MVAPRKKRSRRGNSVGVTIKFPNSFAEKYINPMGKEAFKKTAMILVRGSSNVDIDKLNYAYEYMCKLLADPGAWSLTDLNLDRLGINGATEYEQLKTKLGI